MGRGTLNGRFARLLRDGNQDGGPGGGGGGAPAGQGQGQGGSGQGGAGAGSGAGGGGSGSLDDLFDDVDDTGQGGNQGGNGQQGDQSQGFSQQQLDQLTTMFESAMDRRINTLMQGRRRRQPPQQDRNQQDNQQQTPAAPVVDAGAQREARIAFREYVGDEIQRFVSPVERQAAMAFGQNRVSAWDGDGDPDEFGRQVAREVAATVKGLRDHYRDLTVRQLRKRGLLLESGAPGQAQQLTTPGIPGGGSLAPTTIPAPTKAAQAVQHAVALAGEFNVRNGHVQQPQPAAT